MNHLTEEQLILHYYGEEGETLAVERHLEECLECRGLYGSLQRVLNVVDTLPVPDVGPEYGPQVWARIAPRIPARRRLALPGFAWRWAAAGAACAGLIVAAFLAGRFWQPRQKPAQMAAAADARAHESVLLVAVGDYLERSQLVLVELSNARAGHALDISAEQERAGDLVSESRLYRQTALRTGNTAVASVLDDLDRVLLDIAHSPSTLSPGELEKLRQRLEAEGILFKIRVLGSNVRSQEEPAKLEGNPAARKL
ncbi:MAG TPA: hypothetical protein VGS58_03860 [Candidatus Sulfopaludibacter sp.]|nr:hypothetical protein [Candidatus Sulfopaludibacter sp.]